MVARSHCTAQAGRCRWPSCGTAISVGNRFSDAAVASYLATTRAFAVEIRGPPGTIVLFDGHNVHRGKMSTAEATRYTLTNYHDAPMLVGGTGSGGGSGGGSRKGGASNGPEMVQRSERCLLRREEERQLSHPRLTACDSRKRGHCGQYELTHKAEVGAACRTSLGDCSPRAGKQQEVLFCASAAPWWGGQKARSAKG